MNYAECLKYLAGPGSGVARAEVRPGGHLPDPGGIGRPHERYDTAIVAGTNGKGSTCAMLASILQHAGYRTGLFTSPHLVRVNERMRVNGQEISDDDFAAAFTEVAAAVERLVNAEEAGEAPELF